MQVTINWPIVNSVIIMLVCFFAYTRWTKSIMGVRPSVSDTFYGLIEGGRHARGAWFTLMCFLVGIPAMWISGHLVDEAQLLAGVNVYENTVRGLYGIAGVLICFCGVAPRARLDCVLLYRNSSQLWNYFDLLMIITESLKNKINSNYHVDENGCWIWEKSRVASGHGYIWIPKIGKQYVHRISFLIHNGQIPDGFCVIHKCDNPLCINPEHLFLGTRRDSTINWRNREN